MTSDMKSLMTEPTPSRRRWFKFSLRGLLVFITLVACFLGWTAYERSQSKFERKIGERLQEQGCTVQFHGIYNRHFWKNGYLLDENPYGWWRDLARQFLGERIWSIEYFSGPEKLSLLARLSNLKELRIKGEPGSDLTPLAELKQLEWLSLGGRFINDITPLAELKKLETLHLMGMPDNDLSPLAELKQLKTLHFQTMSVSDLSPLSELKKLETLLLMGILDSDLSPLAELKNLKQLRLIGSSGTDEQVESLQQALPNCRIFLR